MAHIPGLRDRAEDGLDSDTRFRGAGTPRRRVGKRQSPPEPSERVTVPGPSLGHRAPLT